MTKIPYIKFENPKSQKKENFFLHLKILKTIKNN